MKTRGILIGCMLLSLLASACGGAPDGSIGASQALQQQLSGQSTTVPGRMLVKFKSGASATQIASYEHDHGAVVLQTIPYLDVAVLQTRGPFLKADDPEVDYAEPDVLRRVALVPDAPRFGEQYGLQRIDAPEAWNITMGDPRIVVAVVDTGVDLDHPDLRTQLVPGVSFVDQLEDPKGDGSSAVVPVSNQGPIDDNGHGTNVAGIIGAADNGTGVVGVAPRCKIMPVKVLGGPDGTGFDSNISAGIVWAVNHGARVINLSLGGEGGSRTLEGAIDYAIAHDVVVCAAMGNDGDNAQANYGTSVNYPAAYPGVIAVGATDQHDQPASLFPGDLTFSNRGRWIALSAPGLDIMSTMPTYPVSNPEASLDYGTMSGTSQATPFVSGAAALLLSVNPQLTPGEVKTLLEETADDVGTPGFDSYTGYGRLNVYKALMKVIGGGATP